MGLVKKKKSASTFNRNQNYSFVNTNSRALPLSYLKLIRCGPFYECQESANCRANADAFPPEIHQAMRKRG